MARVLVIDDEADVRLLCRINLEHAGHEVSEAANAEMGLRIAHEVGPDVVVLDVMLPLRDGISVLEALVAGRPSIPVLLLTVKSHPEDRFRGWEAGPSRPPSAALDALGGLEGSSSSLYVRTAESGSSDGSTSARMENDIPPLLEMVAAANGWPQGPGWPDSTGDENEGE